MAPPPRLPVIHAETPIEELPLPELNGTWRQPSSDAPLRIFRQGRRVFFVGELVAGANPASPVFKTPLPEGWRPDGNYWFPVYSAGAHIMFKIDKNGNLTHSYRANGGSYDWFPLNSIQYIAEN